MLCHGSGKTRALGLELDEGLAQIRDFLMVNTREVVVLEFGDMDGDYHVIISYILARLEAYFPKMFSVGGAHYTDWPTLGDMVEKNERIVVFMNRGKLEAYRGARPSWLKTNDDLFPAGHAGHDKGILYDEVAKRMMQHCDEPITMQSQRPWECLDYE